MSRSQVRGIGAYCLARYLRFDRGQQHLAAGAELGWVCSGLDIIAPLQAAQTLGVGFNYINMLRRQQIGGQDAANQRFRHLAAADTAKRGKGTHMVFWKYEVGEGEIIAGYG